MEFEAWLLDAYADRGTAVVWLIDKSGRPVRAHFKYRPEFYVSADEAQRSSLRAQIESLTGVMAVEEVVRREAMSAEQRTVLKVTMADTTYFGKMVNRLKQLKFVELYNTHLMHSQRVLFKLGLEPGCKALVDVGYDGSLLGATKIDDQEVLPPPFRIISFKLSKKGNHSIDRIEVFNDSAKLGELVGEPNKILFEFASVIRSEDPDILICNSCEETFSMLWGMSRLYGLNLQLGRDRTDVADLPRPLPYWVRGRVVLDEEQFNPLLGCWGLAGILERSRFGFIPLDLAAQWTSNRLVDSRNSYELLQRDYLIPSKPKFFEYSRELQELGAEDKGAMMVPPLVGLQENVAELDFESEFANVIIKNNISYESFDYSDGSLEGLLPSVMRRFLARRLYFKRLRKSLNKESAELDYCEQRQTSLKLILCVLYGTSGCAWNRFGNVLTFERINAVARDIMLKAVQRVEEDGFKVVYADTDALFIRRDGATPSDYDRMAEAIFEAVGMPIALSHHYRHLVLLPRKMDSRTPAFKRYYGLTFGGELVCRGIEQRRHDTPLFVKEVQEAMMRALLSQEGETEVYSRGLPEALRILGGAQKQLSAKHVETYRLVINKELRQDAELYATTPPHVSAALRLKMEGEAVESGDVVSFVYGDSAHGNPLCRAIPAGMEKEGGYDVAKYRELMVSAAQTILSPFLAGTKEVTHDPSTLDAYL
jgi:DNA polymerase-2